MESEKTPNVFKRSSYKLFLKSRIKVHIHMEKPRPLQMCLVNYMLHFQTES